MFIREEFLKKHQKKWGSEFQNSFNPNFKNSWKNRHVLVLAALLVILNLSCTNSHLSYLFSTAKLCGCSKTSLIHVNILSKTRLFQFAEFSLLNSPLSIVLTCCADQDLFFAAFKLVFSWNKNNFCIYYLVYNGWYAAHNMRGKKKKKETSESIMEKRKSQTRKVSCNIVFHVLNLCL